jgi:hypothetical protein
MRFFVEKGDIAPTIHKRIACWFEDLIIHKVNNKEKRKSFFRRGKEQDEEEWVRAEVRTWRANEMPLKSLYHMVNQLGLGVDVYTYMEPELAEAAEHWLARKGISVVVYPYEDFEMLRDDFRYNRDVHTLFTPYEEDAGMLGLRATVVRSDGTFGI